MKGCTSLGCQHLSAHNRCKCHCFNSDLSVRRRVVRHWNKDKLAIVM